MRIMPLLGAVIIALAALPTNGSLAQNYNPRDALSSRLGATRCGDFAGMGRAARDDIVRRMARSAPPQSLAGVTVTLNSKNSRDRPIGDTGNNASVPGTPLTAGELIAACQAVSRNSTLRDAYSHFNSGSNLLTNRRR